MGEVIFVLNMLTKENVTLAIAVAGFAMSLATWIKDSITQRKHIECKILDIKSFVTVTYFNVLIENRSRIPISITNIEIIFGDERYMCTQLPVLVSESSKSSKGEVYDRTMTYSTPVPIQIQGLGATAPLVLFEKMKQLPPDDATHLILLISTNRGKPVQMKLELPAGWAAQRNKP